MKLFDRFKMTLISCEYCGSKNTKFYNVTRKNNENNKVCDYIIECTNCGAKAKINESWSKKVTG